MREDDGTVGIKVMRKESKIIANKLRIQSMPFLPKQADSGKRYYTEVPCKYTCKTVCRYEAKVREKKCDLT